MTRLEKIEKDIKALSDKEVHHLADWFAEWRADLWDQQIEEDAKAGKLDKLAKRALANHKAGRTTSL